MAVFYPVVLAPEIEEMRRDQETFQQQVRNVPEVATTPKARRGRPRKKTDAATTAKRSRAEIESKNSD
ncbi:MAG: hypothetical protein GY696_29325 [Gammaproteobacteria bacterium]|nr:hypothetical protein [Gammaproteobacteria bacterium]